MTDEAQPATITSAPLPTPGNQPSSAPAVVQANPTSTPATNGYSTEVQSSTSSNAASPPPASQSTVAQASSPSTVTTTVAELQTLVNTHVTTAVNTVLSAFTTRVHDLEQDLHSAKGALASLGMVMHAGKGHGGWFRKWLKETFGDEPEPPLEG